MNRDKEKAHLPLLGNRNELQSVSLFESFVGNPKIVDSQGRIHLGNRFTKCKGNTQKKSSQTTARESFRRLAKSVSPSEWMLVDGLYNGLDALLKATRITKALTSTGASSLFASCIRKVPEHIIREQRMVEAEDPDPDNNIASEIYADLESYGLSECGGWKPLRELVRAHGIAILGGAIADGSINALITRGLVLLCTQASAYNEAEHLIRSLITVTPPLSKPRALSDRLFTADVCLCTLNDFYHRTDRHSFFYRQLTSMLSSRIIPVEWISSYDMIGCWNKVMGHIIAEDSHAEEASLMLRCAVSMGYSSSDNSISSKIHLRRMQLRVTPSAAIRLHGQKDVSGPGDKHSDSTSRSDEHKQSSMFVAVTNTITNLLTVLLSLGIVHCRARDSGGINTLTTHSAILQGLATEAQRCYEILLCAPSHVQEFSVHEVRLAIVLLAHGTLEMILTTSDPEDIQRKRGWLTIVNALNDKAKVTDQLSSFLCAVAHCCDRAGPKEGFKYLQCMLQRFLDLPLAQVGRGAIRSLIQRVSMDAAFDFAEGTNQKEQLDWALELEENIHAEGGKVDGKIMGRTPARSFTKPSTGFRWEEGICEWIARTPAVALAKTRAHQSIGNPCRAPDKDQDHGQMDKSPSLSRRPTGRRVSSMPLDGENECLITQLQKEGHCFPDLCSAQSERELSDDVCSSKPKARLSHVRRKSQMGEGDEVRTVQNICVLDNDADELSTHESSQEQQCGERRPVLRELSNLASKIGRRTSAGRKRRPPNPGRRQKHSSLLWEMGENVSEDELGM